MSYPVTANWIRFKRTSENEYKIVNLLDNNELKVDSYMVWFASRLNGKRNPYKIDERLSEETVDLLLNKLAEKNIIRDKRFLSKSVSELLITVWRPHITPNFRMVAYFINGLLLMSWLPLLVFSVNYFFDNLQDLNADYITLGIFVGLFIGLFLHELGHMLACLAYGGKVFEVGVMLLFFMPGAYVLLNENKIKNRMHRIQVSAVGIEMNLLLVGIFLILSANFEALSGFFLGSALQNLFLALFNLIFVNGFDGMAIMGELLGVEELVTKAKRITKSDFMRYRLKKDGISGKVTIGGCYILRIIQLALPLIIAVNIVGVISWFL